MKVSIRTKFLTTAIIFASAQISTAAFAANPTLDPTRYSSNVGVGSIKTVGNTTTLTTTTDASVANWASINTTANQILNIAQPHNYSFNLSKVTNGQATDFSGQLKSNGSVILENQAGLIFRKGSSVNLSAIAFTTASNIQLIPGAPTAYSYKFSGMTYNPITLDGTITTPVGGHVDAMGEVIDIGQDAVINTPRGVVDLQTGADQFWYSPTQTGYFGTNGVINVQGSSISIKGQINAQGGGVNVSAIGSVPGYTALNLSGVIDVSSFTNSAGKTSDAGSVVLQSYGSLADSGTIKAQGTNTDGGTKGGFVQLGSVGNVNVKGNIDASSVSGKNTVSVGSVYGNTTVSGDIISTGSSKSSTAIGSEAGNVTVAGDVLIGTGTAHINAAKNVVISGHVNAQGNQPGSVVTITPASNDAGNIKVASGGNTTVDGYLDAGSPLGNAGTVTITSRKGVTTAAKIAGNKVTITAAKNVTLNSSSDTFGPSYVTAYSGGYAIDDSGNLTRTDATGPGTGGTIAIKSTTGSITDNAALISGNINSGGTISLSAAKGGVSVAAPVVTYSQNGAGGNVNVAAKTYTTTANTNYLLTGATGTGNVIVNGTIQQ